MKKQNSAFLIILLCFSIKAEAHGQEALLWGIGLILGFICIVILAIQLLSNWKNRLIAIFACMPIPMFMGMWPSTYFPEFKNYFFILSFWPMLISGVAAIYIIRYVTSLRKASQGSISPQTKNIKIQRFFVCLLIAPFIIAAMGVIAGFAAEHKKELTNIAFNKISTNDSEDIIVSLIGKPDFEKPCVSSADISCVRETYYQQYLTDYSWVIRYSSENRVLSKDIYIGLPWNSNNTQI